MINIKLIKVICFLFSHFINFSSGAQAIGGLIRSQKGKYSVNLSGCGIIEKQCSHFHDDLSILSCALNATQNNKTQATILCQHNVWMHQAELLDNAYIDYKLREPCQEEQSIMDCLSPTEFSIDCILKRKPSIKDKTCWTVINNIELLIFNDWQITGNFLRNCFFDIHALNCGRVPTDLKSMSQILTLKCLQSQIINVKPICQSEINVLNEMKYNTLQLDKIVFAACNLDLKNFCLDEVPGSLLMYKCLVRHKYEKGIILL